MMRKLNDIPIFELFSKYRQALFGIAAISIVLVHFPAPQGSLYQRLYGSLVGSIGVEIFAILSGYGLYFAYSKKPRIGQFYLRRGKRVIVPYLLISAPLLLISTVTLGGGDVSVFLQRISFVSFFRFGDVRQWYVAFILCMYLLYPVFDFLARKMKNCFVLIMLITFIGILALKQYAEPFYQNTQNALWRVLSFEAGIMFAMAAQKKIKLNWWIIGLVVFGFVIMLVNAKLGHIWDRLPRFFYGISCIILLVLVIDRLPFRPLITALEKTGIYSFEVYITHVLLLEIAEAASIDVSSFLSYSILVYISVILSLGTKFITNALFSKG